MTKVPFHRRVFLWVIVVIFFILAPAVVFYTSGFRWNGKKGMIERNGTLIIDTQPTGATISLNGTVIPQKTSATLQNTAPGTYSIRLEIPGYAAWQKTLEVRPSLVTFVNAVRLWRNSTPERIVNAPIAAVAASPNGRVLATVQAGAGNATTLVFRDIPVSGDVVPNLAAPGTSQLAFESSAPTGTVHLLWNDAGSDILVTDDSGHEWLADHGAATQNALMLPSGVWRWNGNVLVGERQTGVRVEQSQITPRTGATVLTDLPLGTVDQDGIDRVETTTGTDRLSVVEQGRSGKHFELPAGNWTIAERQGDWLFLTDGNEWLGFDPSDSAMPSIRVPADAAVSFIKRGKDTLFLSNGGSELWEGTLGQTPDLLLRTSEPIVEAAWHREGNYVFYATTHDLVVLGLDARDGRSRNTLGSFDRIENFTVVGGAVYVAAERSGVSGLWKLEVE